MTIVFVFGSNTKGRHGKGAAAYAQKYYGAVYGQGEGRQGDSYAIPTKDGKYHDLTNPEATLSLDEIRKHLRKFIKYAVKHPECLFLMTPIGTGEAGYKKSEILSLLHDIAGNRQFGTKTYSLGQKKPFQLPRNITFTKEWYML